MRRALTEQEKIRIIELVHEYGHQWKLIGSIIDRPFSTCKSFYDSYCKNGTLFPRLGRPPEITRDIENGVIGSIQSDGLQKLSNISKDFDISESTARKILIQNNINYYEKTPITGLKPDQKINRINFCSYFMQFNYKNLPKIIFTDESFVQNYTNRDGIWRIRGFHPPESYYERELHPTSVMIWGGIGPLGYRTKLLNFSQKVNAEYYCRSLFSNGVFTDLNFHFGRNWVWQEDNAPPHRAKNTKNFLSNIVPAKITWPAVSPDLSCIEHVWNYLKNDIPSIKYFSKDALFHALEISWNSIPNQLIHNYYSSFLARVIECYRINGDSLNGHWSEVKEIHDQYRTQLYSIRNSVNGLYSIIEL